MPGPKNLLVIDPALTQDPGKSFPALILKYLSRLGWSPTIVTVRPDNPLGASVTDWFGVKIVAAPPSQGFHNRGVRWLYRKRREFTGRRNVLLAEGKQRDVRAWLFAGGDLALLPVTVLAAPSGERSIFAQDIWPTLLELHRKQPFHAVMSIYGTFLSHELAWRFKDRAGIPWIALTKDYYSGLPFTRGRAHDAPLPLQRSRDAVKRRREGKVLSHSTTIVAYCDALAEYLRGFIANVRIKVISNCYDEEDYTEALGPRAPEHNQEFVIGCVGAVSYHDLRMFFEALQELKSEGSYPNLKARFVGAEEPIMHSYARQYRCDGALEIVPRVSHEEAVLHMRRATCLLFPQIPFELPRRTPEYMAARRPILAFPRCPTAASEPVIQQYGAAVVVSSKEEIKATLLNWYQQFQTTGKLALPVNEDFVQSFSARHRAEELHEVLEGAMGSRCDPRIAKG